MLKLTLLLPLVASVLLACGGGKDMAKLELAPEAYLRCAIHVETAAPDSANVSLELMNEGSDGVTVLQPSSSTITWMLDHGRKVMDVNTDDRAITMTHKESLTFRDSIMIPTGARVESALLRTGRIPDVLTCPVQ